MAMFKNSTIKPVKGYIEMENFGMAMKIKTVTPSKGGMILEGEAISNSKAGQVGDPIKVFMAESHFKQNIGHSMSRSLKDAYAVKEDGSPKRKPDYFAGTEVALSRCYEKEGNLIARGGAVGTYCVAGEVESKRAVASSLIVGRPVIEMVDGDERASTYMNSTSATQEEVVVRIKTERSNESFRVPVQDFLDTLNGRIEAQRAANQRQYEGKGKEDTVLSVQLDVYSPDEGRAITSPADFGQPTSNMALIASNGAHQSYYAYTPEGEGAEEYTAKKLKKVGDFIEQHGEVQVMPFDRLYFDKQKAVEFAEAYSNMLSNRTVELPFEQAWEKYEKTLSSVNELKNDFTPAIMVAFTFKRQDGGIGHSIERIIPSSSIGLNALPTPNLASTAPVVEKATEVAAPEEGPVIDDEVDFAKMDPDDPDLMDVDDDLSSAAASMGR